MPKFSFYKQHDHMDCGPTCLRMVSKFYGKYYTLQTLREKASLQKDGVSLLNLSEAAESIGFRSINVKITLEQLIEEAPLPCIVHWGENHFLVVYHTSAKKNIFSRKDSGNFKEHGIIHTADPAKGKLKYSYSEFYNKWAIDNNKGYALLLEPTSKFYQEEDEEQNSYGFSSLLIYIKQHTKLLWQLLFGFILGSIFQLIIPFLMQSIIDVGISSQSISFVTLVIIGYYGLNCASHFSLIVPAITVQMMPL